MAYTALEELRKINAERYGEDVGPFQPPMSGAEGTAGAALRFLRECEGLRFDPAAEEEEKADGVLRGTSLSAGQIPYNMQMDIDRLCLEKSLEAFLGSGSAGDACRVYYCFLTMFYGPWHTFKGTLKAMEGREEALAESAAFFARGLAVYETDENVRKAYGHGPGRYLKDWGRASLFEDVPWPGEALNELLGSVLRATVGLRAGEPAVPAPEPAAHRISFGRIVEFAAALNGRYSYEGQEDKVTTERMERDFESLSLEYQLSNIHQAASLEKYLRTVDCVLTDRPGEGSPLESFTPEMAAVFGPLEHERWVREHRAMGWRAGDIYERLPVPEGENPKAWRKALRERIRRHALAMDGPLTRERIEAHYNALPESEKGKDWKPFNALLRLIAKYEGLSIRREG